jgi:septum formation protein
VFEVMPSEYEEDMTLSMPPKDLVMFLSKGKAEAVSMKNPDAVVIGADTFIVFEGKILGKPHTAERAEEMLRMLRNSSCTLLSGFTIMENGGKSLVSKVDEATVYFKNYNDDVIKEYIETGEPLDKAGAFAVQGAGAKLIDHFEGSFETIMGLPLEMVVSTLHDFGVYPNLSQSE